MPGDLPFLSYQQKNNFVYIRAARIIPVIIIPVIRCAPLGGGVAWG